MFDLTPVWAPVELPTKRAKTAEVRLSCTGDVSITPRNEENAQGSSDEEDSDSSGSNSDVSSEDDTSDVSDLDKFEEAYSDFGALTARVDPLVLELCRRANLTGVGAARTRRLPAAQEGELPSGAPGTEVTPPTSSAKALCVLCPPQSAPLCGSPKVPSEQMQELIGLPWMMMTSQKSFPSCSRVYCRMCIRKGRPLRAKVPNRKNLRCQCSSQGPALRQNGEVYYNPDANSGLH